MAGDKPRSIPAQERAWHVALAVLLLAYGGFGLYYDDIYIPGKRSKGIHVHGMAAWIMYAAFVCAALNLLSILADHCDSDTDVAERRYHIFARTTQVVGWAFFVASIICELIPSRRQW
jgi:hypothetical protein